MPRLRGHALPLALLAFALTGCSGEAPSTPTVPATAPAAPPDSLALGTATLVFASGAQGRRALAAHDEFVERMSTFDLSARLKTDRPVDRAEYLSHAAASVRDWEPAQQAKLRAAAGSIAAAVARLDLELPERILLVRTTGAEEGGAAYTRGTAIVLPDAVLTADGAETANLLAHELFHVYSRALPARRSALYGTIGFRPCGELEFPPTLADRKITNPDAPRNEFCIEATHDGHPHWMLPILFARTPYDAKKGGEFFEYLELRFLLVGVDADGNPDANDYDRAAPALAPIESLGGFTEQIGANTKYAIHPEEVLADHFALLVGGGPAPTPERIDALRAVLASPSASKR